VSGRIVGIIETIISSLCPVLYHPRFPEVYFGWTDTCAVYADIIIIPKEENRYRIFHQASIFPIFQRIGLVLSVEQKKKILTGSKG
jgi:hypothetical protein